MILLASNHAPPPTTPATSAAVDAATTFDAPNPKNLRISLETAEDDTDPNRGSDEPRNRRQVPGGSFSRLTRCTVYLPREVEEADPSQGSRNATTQHTPEQEKGRETAHPLRGTEKPPQRLAAAHPFLLTCGVRSASGHRAVSWLRLTVPLSGRGERMRACGPL